jgi:cephalosporin-C deacetylase-like acetyl esterase
MNNENTQFINFCELEKREAELIIESTYCPPRAATIVQVGHYEVRYFTTDGVRIKTYLAPRDINDAKTPSFLRIAKYLQAHGWREAKRIETLSCVSIMSSANYPKWFIRQEDVPEVV